MSTASIAATSNTIEAFRAWMAVHALIIHESERRLAEANAIPLTWYEVLLRLAQAPGGELRMQDLASQLLLSRSSATRLADRIEAAGLIRREICASDRRGMVASLTPAGREAFAATQPILRAVMDEKFSSHVSDADAKKLTRVLASVLEAHERSQRAVAATAAT
jgi:DNA-binding MarR family transcriptional regulator